METKTLSVEVITLNVFCNFAHHNNILLQVITLKKTRTMKKHFLMVATVAVGMMVAFASCKDNKRSHADDEDDENDVENVESDLEDDDEDDELTAQYADKLKSMDDLNALDIEGMSADEADALLALATSVASKELPEDMGDGMQMVAMTVDGDDVTFNVKADESQMGMTMTDFNAALQLPEMKEMMIASMSQGVDDDMMGFMKIVKKAGKNMVMKFVNDKGDAAELRLTNEEMGRIIK